MENCKQSFFANRQMIARILLSVFGILVLNTLLLGQSPKAKPVDLPFIIPDEMLNITFNPEGTEVFCTIPYRDARRSYVLHAIKKGNEWMPAEKAFFTSGTHQETMPHISSDGKTLIYFSNRPYDGKPGKNDFDAWQSHWKGDRWSSAEPWREINSDSVDYFGSFSRNGNFYFTSSRRGTLGQEDIWILTTRKKLTVIENVGAPLNTEALNSIPAISPDEKFMIFFSNTKIKEDYGSGDLYISFRKGKKWSRPLNLGTAVNSEFFELAPFISHDSKKLYFVRATPRAEPPYQQWNYNLYEIQISDLNIRQLRQRAQF